MPRDQLILPSSIADAIVNTGANSGDFGVRRLPGDELYVVSGFGVTGHGTRQVHSDWQERHCTSAASYQPRVGFWYRATTAELHQAWQLLAARDVGTTTEFFREHVKGWNFPGEVSYPVLTFTTDKFPGEPTWCAWAVAKNGVMPLDVEVVREDADMFTGLNDSWPLDTLEQACVLVVGVGSIGSAAAEALQEYGIRHFALLDPDRLWVRNLARHRLSERDIGRYKVNAMAEVMRARDRDAVIAPLTLDVVNHADLVRGILPEIDVMMVCSDGVESRQVANHLACWAGTPAVFACVLVDGGVGEILRVRPRASKCLLCFRQHLIDAEALDPEPGLDLPYGTGTRHLPMTAVGGDLDLVGKVAAKAAVATLLEKAGRWEHRLPGDHAVIGLRSALGLTDPFNAPNSGIEWHDTGTPAPNCVSCARS
jgi:hypothetical protein